MLQIRKKNKDKHYKSSLLPCDENKSNIHKNKTQRKLVGLACLPSTPSGVTAKIAPLQDIEAGKKHVARNQAYQIDQSKGSISYNNNATIPLVSDKMVSSNKV